MNWASLLPSRWLRAKKAPARRPAKSTRLVCEILEDRLAPAAINTSSPLYQVWAKETFTIDDALVGKVNAAIGPMALSTVPEETPASVR